MKDLLPFAQLGFHLVPLNGLITREDGGRKKLPAFPPMWKEKYLATAYDPVADNQPVALTGAFITGNSSGAISVDCDDQKTLDIFRALDPEYEFVFMSKDKPAGGGSVIYRINDEIKDLEAFKIHNSTMQLDYLTDDLLQFLPTSGNQSKVEWEGETLKDLPELREPSPSVITLLKILGDLKKESHVAQNSQGQLTNAAQSSHYKNLAPFIDSFLQSKDFFGSLDLFRILCPKSMRDLPQYKAEQTLHPDNVPDGLGNEYMTSICGTLVFDDSVSPTMFTSFIKNVNKLWSDPMDKDSIETRIKHQLKRPEWVYDDRWRERVPVILTRYGTLINIFYDPLTKLYYVVDNKTGMLSFVSVDALPKHINSVVQGSKRYATKDMFGRMDQKHVVVSPLEEHGDISAEFALLGRYNLFSRSRAYDILLNPEKYEEEFKGKTPHNTIAFFNHLVPDEETRKYLLRFILTKLTTMNFSEVVIYMLGVMGSGKNLFMDWLAKFTENRMTTAGADYQLTVEVDLPVFLEKYNLWVKNALFANLDEYGEKSSHNSEDKRIMAQLKSYTGKEQFQLRTMHTDATSATHKCTFVLTANENRLSPDLSDRRLFMIDTPEALKDAEFVQHVGGKTMFVRELFEEQELWAYYWATEFKPLSNDQYRTPPDTAFKRKLIMRHLPPSKKIAAALQTQDVDATVEMFESVMLLDELHKDAQKGVITKKLLADLFAELTVNSSNAPKSMLDRALRESRIAITQARVGGPPVRAIAFPKLKRWAERNEIVGDIAVLKDEDT